MLVVKYVVNAACLAVGALISAALVLLVLAHQNSPAVRGFAVVGVWLLLVFVFSVAVAWVAVRLSRRYFPEDDE